MYGVEYCDIGAAGLACGIGSCVPRQNYSEDVELLPNGCGNGYCGVVAV